MKKLILFLSFAFSSTGFLFAEGIYKVPCQSDALVALLKDADAAYAKRLDDKEARRALELYEKAVAEDSSCAVPMINGSQAAWWVADHSASKKEKIETFQKGIDLAKQAIALSSNSAAAHFWLAGNYGSYGEVKGVMKSLALIKPIRRELEDVLNINPNFDEGGAYRVLGVVDYKVPGLAGGNKKRAKEELEKALAIGPKNAFNIYYMAEYFATVGDDDAAKTNLDLLDKLTATEAEMPDWTMMKEKGKVLRAGLK